MRILQVHKYFHERDGAGRSMLALMRLLDAAGHVTAPFGMHTPQNLPTPWEKYFVSSLDTRELGGIGTSFAQLGRALWSREAARKIDAMMYAFAPDIVHAHNIYTHLSPSVLAAAQRRGVPVVMTVHDYALMSANYALWDGGKPLPLGVPGVWKTARTKFIKGSFLATLMLEAIRALHHFVGAYDKNIDRYIAPSEFVAKALGTLGVAESRVTVVHPPVAVPPRVVRHDEGYVLFVGRLEAYKGVATLIEAMRALPDAALRIVGDGPDRQRLMGMARGMRNVTFVGFLQGEALWEEYAGARMLVVPSVWYEPFGVVALEAMARGVPVIVSDRGGLPEIVEDGASGVVFAAQDAKDLAVKILRLAEDRPYAGTLGKAGLARAREVGDPVAHRDAVLRVYRSVLKDA